MTTFTVLILLAVAFALLASVGLSLPRRRPQGGVHQSAPTSGGVESELLRRPLRSRYHA